jgi:hypothetical protein
VTSTPFHPCTDPLTHSRRCVLSELCHGAHVRSFPLLLGIVDHRSWRDRTAQYRLRWTATSTRAVAKLATAADVADLVPIVDDPPAPALPPKVGMVCLTLRLLLLGPISKGEALEMWSDTSRTSSHARSVTVHQVTPCAP